MILLKRNCPRKRPFFWETPQRCSTAPWKESFSGTQPSLGKSRTRHRPVASPTAAHALWSAPLWPCSTKRSEIKYGFPTVWEEKPCNELKEMQCTSTSLVGTTAQRQALSTKTWPLKERYYFKDKPYQQKHGHWRNDIISKTSPINKNMATEGTILFQRQALSTKTWPLKERYYFKDKPYQQKHGHWRNDIISKTSPINKNMATEGTILFQRQALSTKTWPLKERYYFKDKPYQQKHGHWRNDIISKKSPINKNMATEGTILFQRQALSTKTWPLKERYYFKDKPYQQKHGHWRNDIISKTSPINKNMATEGTILFQRQALSTKTWPWRNDIISKTSPINKNMATEGTILFQRQALSTKTWPLKERYYFKDKPYQQKHGHWRNDIISKTSPINKNMATEGTILFQRKALSTKTWPLKERYYFKDKPYQQKHGHWRNDIISKTSPINKNMATEGTILFQRQALSTKTWPLKERYYFKDKPYQQKHGHWRNDIISKTSPINKNMATEGTILFQRQALSTKTWPLKERYYFKDKPYQQKHGHWRNDIISKTSPINKNMATEGTILFQRQALSTKTWPLKERYYFKDKPYQQKHGHWRNDIISKTSPINKNMATEGTILFQRQALSTKTWPLKERYYFKDKPYQQKHGHWRNDIISKTSPINKNMATEGTILFQRQALSTKTWPLKERYYFKDKPYQQKHGHWRNDIISKTSPINKNMATEGTILFQRQALSTKTWPLKERYYFKDKPYQQKHGHWRNDIISKTSPINKNMATEGTILFQRQALSTKTWPLKERYYFKDKPYQQKHGHWRNDIISKTSPINKNMATEGMILFQTEARQ